MKSLRQNLGGRGAFTLVELLVSMVILLLILLVLVQITDAASRSWKSTTSKVEQFREARNTFETMTRRLAQATLNTYWDYYPNPTSPTKYLRQSELRFTSGIAVGASGIMNPAPTVNVPVATNHAVFFQAPLGYVTNTTSYAKLDTLLNTCGYYIAFGSDQDSMQRPAFVTAATVPYRYRFRIMEMVEPSDTLTLYKYTSGYTDATDTTTKNSTYTFTNLGTSARTWFTDPLGGTAPPVHALGENIVAMILLPKLPLADQMAGVPPYTDASLAPNYLYDSSTIGAAQSATTTAQAGDWNSINQLPPLVQVTMVAVDEPSFSRYQGTATSRPSPEPIFANCPFTTASAYSTDLQTLQSNLVGLKLTYRVYTTDVSIKSAKWSRAQKSATN